METIIHFVEILKYLYFGIPIPLRMAYFLWLVFISLYWYANKHDEYNSEILNVEKEEKVNFKPFFPIIGIFIVVVNQFLLWFEIIPNDIINADLNDNTKVISDIASNAKTKYEEKFMLFTTYILPMIGLIIMFFALRMAGLARAVINGYWNPNIIEFKDKKYQILKTEGIYSSIRHPIYVAQFLLALGTAIAGTSYLLLLFPSIIGLINIRRAINEDKELTRILGDKFLEYKNSVPACGLGIR